MAKVNKISEISKKKETKRWSKSVKLNEVTKSVDVEELANDGYLVRLTTEGKNKKGDWEWKEDKYFSKDNPLADEVEDSSITELVSSLMNNNSSLTQ